MALGSLEFEEGVQLEIFFQVLHQVGNNLLVAEALGLNYWSEAPSAGDNSQLATKIKQTLQ